MLDQMQIASGFVPVDMSAGANNGHWVDLKAYKRLLIVLFKNAAASGTGDPTITVNQASDVTGTGSKALNIPSAWTKVGTDLSTIGQFTAAVPSTNTLTLTSSAVKTAICVIEIQAANLDVTNGFTCVQATIAQAGSVAQLGGVLYLLGDPRQCDTPVLNASAVV